MVYNPNVANDTNAIKDFIDPAHGHAIRDPIWQHIWLPDSFMPFLQTEPFLKLLGIRQLGPSVLVYPGATHTRFNHSLGVFQVAKRFLERLLAEPQATSLFSLPGAKAFLFAALSHDLGHFPYTHSLKELPLRDHEELTAQLVTAPELAIKLAALGINPQSIAQIVDTKLACSDPELLVYRAILSGVLDPDKLDYLNRDAYFCGVPYGIQDLDFILSRIFLESNTSIGIEIGGISAIEHVLFSKYLMYKAVYWHKTVRTATAMIKRALWCAIDSGGILPEQLYNLDDARFVQLADSLSGKIPALALVQAVQTKSFHETVLEIPFSAGIGAMVDLENLQVRNAKETAIAKALSGSLSRRVEPWEVVIDLPESVSFEVNMPVRNNGKIVSYLDSGTVFTASVVRDFTASLRKVRVLLPAGTIRDESKIAALTREILGGQS